MSMTLTPTRTQATVVEILEGDYAGKEAYVTWQERNDAMDINHIRVTPVDGDPLLSLQLTDQDVKFVRYQ